MLTRSRLERKCSVPSISFQIITVRFFPRRDAKCSEVILLTDSLESIYYSSFVLNCSLISSHLILSYIITPTTDLRTPIRDISTLALLQPLFHWHTQLIYWDNYTEHADTVCTSKETHYVSATEPNRLMLFGETVAVDCENHTEHTDMCG
jgi:hypothetical protein